MMGISSAVFTQFFICMAVHANRSPLCTEPPSLYGKVKLHLDIRSSATFEASTTSSQNSSVMTGGVSPQLNYHISHNDQWATLRTDHLENFIHNLLNSSP